jgi:hypothetical protein
MRKKISTGLVSLLVLSVNIASIQITWRLTGFYVVDFAESIRSHRMNNIEITVRYKHQEYATSIMDISESSGQKAMVEEVMRAAQRAAESIFRSRRITEGHQIEKLRKNHGVGHA